MTTIHQDERRTISIGNGLITITRADGQSRSCPVDAVGVGVPDGAAAQLRKNGEDPAQWFGLGKGATVYVVLPESLRQVLLDGIRAHEAAERATREDPCTVARSEVSRLYAAAERKRDYPGDYFPALAKAHAARKAWEEQYPWAAKAERKSELLSLASDEEDKAVDAMLVDLDGSLSREDQQELAATHRAKADEYRAQAAAL